MEVTITVEREPPSSASYFWAQQFYPNATVDHGGYFGIQTGGIINGQRVGKMLIFSIWNATDAQASPGAFAQTFGGEGVGYSIRKPFSWEEGVPYTFRLEKDGDFWWRLTVSHPGEVPQSLGRIRITRNVELKSRFVAFTEYFGTLPSCESLPYAKASFSNLRLGSAPIPASDCQPYGSCASAARGSLRGQAAVHEVGERRARHRRVVRH